MPDWMDKLQNYHDPAKHTQWELEHIKTNIQEYFTSEEFKTYEAIYCNFFIQKYNLPLPLQSSTIATTLEERMDHVKGFYKTLRSNILEIVNYIYSYAQVARECFKSLYNITLNLSFKHMQAYILIFANFTEHEHLHEERFRVAAKVFDAIGESQLAQHAREKNADPSFWVEHLREFVMDNEIENPDLYEVPEVTIITTTEITPSVEVPPIEKSQSKVVDPPIKVEESQQGSTGDNVHLTPEAENAFEKLAHQEMPSNYIKKREKPLPEQNPMTYRQELVASPWFWIMIVSSIGLLLVLVTTFNLPNFDTIMIVTFVIHIPLNFICTIFIVQIKKQYGIRHYPRSCLGWVAKRVGESLDEE